MRRFGSVVALSWALCACSPEEETRSPGLGALAPDASASQQVYGVVSSDSAASSIALLDHDGELLAESFIHSGSAPAGLVTALSGDVVLPTRSGETGVLTLIDRFRSDVITRVDLASGQVLGQVKTHRPNSGEPDEGGFSSNPQDYVYFDAGTAWVSRFAPRLQGGDDPDGGSDLLRIDPTDFERRERISLWPLNERVEREDPETGERERVTVYARPSTMVRLGDRLVVGLASLSASYDAAGSGKVALVDPERGSVAGVELPGLQNCASVAPVPHDATRVVVACSGFFRGVPREGAGLAMLRLEDDELAIEHLWRGSDDEDAPLSVGNVVSLGGTEVVAVAAGAREVTDDDGNVSEPATGDIAYVVDIESGGQRELFAARGRYSLGGGAFDASRRLLLLPDASTDGDGVPSAGVRRFRRTADGSFEALDVITVHDVLPARQVRPL